MSLSIHTMRALPNEDGWSVGYWLAKSLPPERSRIATVNEWVEICRFKETLDAVRRVNALNGGTFTP